MPTPAAQSVDGASARLRPRRTPSSSESQRQRSSGSFRRVRSSEQGGALRQDATPRSFNYHDAAAAQQGVTPSSTARPAPTAALTPSPKSALSAGSSWRVSPAKSAPSSWLPTGRSGGSAALQDYPASAGQDSAGLRATLRAAAGLRDSVAGRAPDHALQRLSGALDALTARVLRPEHDDAEGYVMHPAPGSAADPLSPTSAENYLQWASSHGSRGPRFNPARESACRVCRMLQFKALWSLGY